MYKIKIAVFVALYSISVPAQKNSMNGYPIKPVPFTAVKVNDSFWNQRIESCRETTIPLAFGKCEETRRYDNFRMAANPSDKNKVEGFTFGDTDVYKTIEGASYSMQVHRDPRMETYIDSLITLIEKAQESDGYLFTFRTMNPENTHEWAGTERWEKEEELSHELYNLGHLVEGAVAHYINR